MRFFVLVSLVASAQCLVLLSNRSKPTAKNTGSVWGKSAPGQSCTDYCSANSMTCTPATGADLGDDNKDIRKTVKQAAKELGLDCAGVTETSDPSAAAPSITVTNAKKGKGPCESPTMDTDIPCDGVGPSDANRLCYCTPQAAQPETYNPLWKEDWVHPGGNGITNAQKFEVCVCYAQKGKSGVDALGDAPAITDDFDDEKCTEYCNGQGSGYHAGEVFYLNEWSNTRRPAVIVVHGQDGSKDQFWMQYTAEYLRDAGYVVMAVNYGGSCDEDVATAIRYLRTNADHFGINTESIGLYGWSAGGRCAYKAGFDNQMGEGTQVSVVISHAGCGGKGPLKNVNKMDGVPPPYLLLAHGERDPKVSWSDCLALSEFASTRKTKQGERVHLEELYFDLKSHNLIGTEVSAALTLDTIYDYLARFLGRPCRVTKGKAFSGAKRSKIMDGEWPVCKQQDGPQIEKCGGPYEDESEVDGSC